ncbi:MAG: hypothetical protein N2578_02135, partial [Bdellovibrionaceae bacterium]|nr:hypothetical protein [Pseudobdellovibrionaceae bacterium]
DQDKSVVINLGDSGGSGGAFFSSNRRARGRFGRRAPRYVAVTGKLKEMADKKAVKSSRAQSQMKVDASEVGTKRIGHKKISVDPPKQNAKQVELPDTELGVSWFVRIFLIAAVIIFIVIVVGGQILSIAKGMEK